jgi:two-component system, OmpR family, sensor histidine kinase KdpD
VLSMRWLGALGREPTRRRTTVVAVLTPTLATLGALVAGADWRVVAASAYLLGVVVAAAFGGRTAGLVAAFLSFLGLNFFFTQPHHTFRVGKNEDLVALVLFLCVAAIVGSLLAVALRDRLRSARRERETAMTSFVGTQLLSGVPLEIVLWRFTTTLTDALELASCEIRAAVGDRRFDANADGDGRPGERVSSVIGVRERVFGSLTIVRRDGAPPLDDDEARVLQVSAEQVAIALERVELDDQIRSARDESETMELRAALFSSVTHDLRSPLASIKAAVTSLLDDATPHDVDQRRELLRTVLEESDRLNRLVGNLMDLARMRSGGLEPAKEPTAIEDIVESVLHRMRAMLSPFRLRTVIRPDLPDVSADPVQLDQALTNLLENAARFSPSAGEIVVTAARWHDVVRLSVSDQGPGVPTEDRERVFEAFYRRDAGAGRAGSGLGLAIVRAIATAHGGRAWLEGSPTGGALVTLELPAARIAEHVH